MTDSDALTGGAPSDAQLAYFLFRITMGVNMFFHGFMRPFTGLSDWVQPMAATFADTYLPMPMVLAFLYCLPFYEMALGAVLILGFRTRLATIGGALMMLVLLYGNTARQDWATAGNNMHYTLYFAGMLVFVHYDCYGLDKRRAT